jgi:hypothetical protein
MIDKYLENRTKLPLDKAKELVDRGGSVIWRPDSSLPEDQQYAIVMNDPEVGEEN